MNTISRFFRTVTDSAFKPSSYEPKLKTKMPSGLGYLYWLLVCSFAVTSLVAAAFYLPARIVIRAFVDAGDPAIQSLYPAELVVTVANGELSTNVQEPYVIDPPFWATVRDEMGDDDTQAPTHLITIDTDASIEDYTEYDTLVFVTATHIVMKGDNEVRLFPLSDIDESFTLDKTRYDEFVATLMPFVRAIPAWIDIAVFFGLLLLPFVGAAFSWAWNLLILLAWSLVLWGISALMGKGLGYGDVYKLGLYGVTLSVLWKTLTWPIPGIGLWFLPSLIFLVFMIIVLKKLPSPVLPAPVSVVSPKKPVRKRTSAPKKPKKLA